MTRSLSLATTNHIMNHRIIIAWNRPKLTAKLVTMNYLLVITFSGQYEAILEFEGEEPIQTGFGDTIENALDDLERKLDE